MKTPTINNITLINDSSKSIPITCKVPISNIIESINTDLKNNNINQASTTLNTYINTQPITHSDFHNTISSMLSQESTTIIIDNDINQGEHQVIVPPNIQEILQTLIFNTFEGWAMATTQKTIKALLKNIWFKHTTTTGDDIRRIIDPCLNGYNCHDLYPNTTIINSGIQQDTNTSLIKQLYMYSDLFTTIRTITDAINILNDNTTPPPHNKTLQYPYSRIMIQARSIKASWSNSPLYRNKRFAKHYLSTIKLYLQQHKVWYNNAYFIGCTIQTQISMIEALHYLSIISSIKENEDNIIIVAQPIHLDIINLIINQ